MALTLTGGNRTDNAPIVDATAGRGLGPAARLALAALAFAIAGASPSLAACSLVADPDHSGGQMLQCGDLVTAHLAEGSVVHPVGRAKASVPSGLRLQTGAALIEFKPQAGAENFRILTPEAIAAVRGTTWAVQVEKGKTSVFVVTGKVEVRARVGDAKVSLGPGEGVDVARSARTLEVKHWGEARVRQLLALFGR